MNTSIEVYKNSLHMTDQQVINSIKKAKYTLSKLETDIIGLGLGRLLEEKNNNGVIFGELKKLTNMIIYLIQTDKISECFLFVDSLVLEEHFRDICGVIRFSGITNKFHIITNKLNDNDFLVNFPEFNIEIRKKSDIIFNKRYVLDFKQEYMYLENVQGEKDVIGQ